MRLMEQGEKLARETGRPHHLWELKSVCRPVTTAQWEDTESDA